VARKAVTLLDQSALEKIHSESLRILENIGMRVDDPECVNILRKAGAKVVGQSNVVLLPAPMVNEAMSQITKKFELVHPTGERFWVPDKAPRVGTRLKPAVPARCHQPVPHYKCSPKG